MSIDFDGGTVKDFQGLEFTLKAGNRTLEEGTDYTLQYPYIILSESLEEEELTLSVNADSLGYTGDSVTAKRADGTFVLPLTPWGKLHITTAGTFAGDNHILVFNQKGDGYLLENDTVMMNTSKKEGVFYLTLVFSKTGAHSIAAAATKDGMTAPIGSAAITVQEISLCPDTVTLTALKGNSVLVTTAPDTNVLLFLDGEEAARGRTNKLGKVCLSYDLPDSSVGGQTFELKTQAQEGGTSAVATGM